MRLVKIWKIDIGIGENMKNGKFSWVPKNLWEFFLNIFRDFEQFLEGQAFFGNFENVFRLHFFWEILTTFGALNVFYEILKNFRVNTRTLERF